MRLLMLRAAFISNVTSIASAPNCRDTAQESDRDYCGPWTVQGVAAHHLSDPQSLGHKAVANGLSVVLRAAQACAKGFT